MKMTPEDKALATEIHTKSRQFSTPEVRAHVMVGEGSDALLNAPIEVMRAGTAHFAEKMADNLAGTPLAHAAPVIRKSARILNTSRAGHWLYKGISLIVGGTIAGLAIYALVGILLGHFDA